jgi:hypothetical protein
VGGLSESNRLNGGVLGQTFSCLFALQFLDLKRGDRFFYENAPDATLGTSKTAFTMSKLKNTQIPISVTNNHLLRQSRIIWEC